MIKTKSGKSTRKCPQCRSSRLYLVARPHVLVENEKNLGQLIGGFFCRNCGFVNKRRHSAKKEDMGKVDFKTYGTGVK